METRRPLDSYSTHLSTSLIMSSDALAITVILSAIRSRGFNTDTPNYYIGHGSSSPAHFVASSSLWIHFSPVSALPGLGGMIVEQSAGEAAPEILNHDRPLHIIS